MTDQAVRELLSRQPFEPFRLIMSSGQAYDVHHREMAILTQTDVAVGVGKTRDAIPNGFKICSMLHIMATTPLPSDTKAAADA